MASRGLNSVENTIQLNFAWEVSVFPALSIAKKLQYTHEHRVDPKLFTHEIELLTRVLIS